MLSMSAAGTPGKNVTIGAGVPRIPCTRPAACSTPAHAYSRCVSNTRYLIIVALPLRRRADQVCDTLTHHIQGLSEGVMRTLTWDQGREMAHHQRLPPGTGVEVFVAHPHSPWERGTDENTNRLILRYLPKGTPITSHQPHIDAIAYEPGNCPKAPLGYRTPTEAFNQLIATTH